MEILKIIYNELINNLDKIFNFATFCLAIWGLLRTRKKAITPQARIYITNKKWPRRTFGGSFSVYHNGPDKMLYVENIGETGFTITNITIDNIEINKIKDIINPEYLLAAKIPPRNIASSECLEKKLKGKVAKMECKTDDGKLHSIQITVSEIY